MPIEIKCSNCQSLLRVADEHAGKSARCPQCSTIIPIPIDGYTQPEFDGGPDSGVPYQSPYQAKPPNPYSAPVADVFNRPTSTGSQFARHRGETILALGIGSYVCCILLGIAAIVMASADLRRMDEGTMDPSGRGLTRAGMILGIIHLVMMAIVFMFGTVLAFVGVL